MMTEKTDQNHSDNPSSVNGSSTPQTPGRIEDLLLDDRQPDSSLAQLAEQEIRLVKHRGRISLNGLLAGLVLILCAVTVGLYFYSAPVATSPPVIVEDLSVETRLVMPQRPDPVPVTEPETESETITVEIVADEPLPTPLTEDDSAVAESPPAVTPAADGFHYRVLVGPFVRQEDQDQALSVVREQGFEPQRITGSGPVRMIRLLAGVYTAPEAKQQLQRLQKVAASAFLLPLEDRLALYAGSFHEQERADRLQKDLADSNIRVTQVDARIVMTGTLLVIVQTDPQKADEVAQRIAAAGLNVQVDSNR